MKSVFNILSICFFLFSCQSITQQDVKLIPVKSGKDFEYINLEGKIIINPQFKEATLFRNGLALVLTSSEKPEWKYIGEDGKYIINTGYKDATVFNEDLAFVVSENAAPICINTKGELKFSLQNAEEVWPFNQGLALFKVTDSSGKSKFGFVDREGKTKITTQFDEALTFSDSKSAIKNSENKWGYIDKDGSIIINCQFDLALPFFKGNAIVKSGEKFGVIDNKGRYVINPQFQEMSFDNGLFIIKQDDKYGWTDDQGKIIINPQFEQAFPFLQNNIAPVKMNKSYGYIDKTGKIIINPQFDFAAPFYGNIALVGSSNKGGFIDKEGKFVINPQYDVVASDYVYRNYSEKSVVTDFFNTDAITQRINFNSPEGLGLNSTIGEILQKLNKTEKDLNPMVDNDVLKRNQVINDDVLYDFSIDGQFFDNRQLGYYNINVFNNNYKPTYYNYIFRLSGKASGKEKLLVEAFEKRLLNLNYKKLKEYKSWAYANPNCSILTNNKVVVFLNYDKFQTIGSSVKVSIDLFETDFSESPQYNNTTQSTPINSTNGNYTIASNRILSSSDLKNLSKNQLKIIRNEIFARHGYIFKTDDMKSYFSAQNWYKPLYDDVTSQLTEIEKTNIAFIKTFER